MATGGPTPAITMTAKALLLALAALCAGLQWQGLRGHLNHQSHHRLAAEAGAGRLESADSGLVAALLAAPAGAAAVFDPHLHRSRAVLHLYAADLIAAAKGLNPLLPASDPEAAAARKAALRQLEAALARQPLDGDLWLRLAVMGRALGLPERLLETYLERSRLSAPYEGWILRRRGALQFNNNL